MTKFLSEAMQAEEPFFRLGLRRLESANGNPSTDIRFTSEVKVASSHKLHELGVDPNDTTPQELYHILQERLRRDDAKLARTLQTTAATHVSAEADVMAGMVYALNKLPDSKRCYALKASSFKAIIKKLPPKRTLKQLGYRSLDSFLKHESPVNILAATALYEDQRWQLRLQEQYTRLKPSDFENRSISITQADFKGWRELAHSSVAERKHNVLCFKELGAVVLLPLPADMPAGAVVASMTLALHDLNSIRATSTFLKLSQVRADFGDMVQLVVREEARLNSEILDKPVSWHLVQRYYARLSQHFNEAVFEPHIQLDDMVWHPVEATLAKIEPSLQFWSGSGHLGLMHGHRPVSCNILDAALNLCNGVPFEKRIVHYFQQNLWYELLLRYMQPRSLEQTILHELHPQLATEMALN